MPIRLKYWESKAALHRAVRARMNITYQLGDKPTRDRGIEPLKSINHELSICRDAINKFN